MRGLTRRLREERGISAVVVMICMIGMLGAAVLTIDSGSIYKTKRQLVTDTDAAALAAARMFATGAADPCTPGGRTAAEAEALQVFLANNPSALHDNTNTPNGFQVDTGTNCSPHPPAGQIAPGHVRFDGRLFSTSSFSGIFNAGNTNVVSSSTADFGYLQGNPGGLRPWTVCDQHNSTFPNPLPDVPPPPSSPYPHYELFRQLRNWILAGKPATEGSGQVSQTHYNHYFGAGATGDPNVDEYPTVSFQGGNFLSPANGGGVVHRINATDDCGGGAAWRGWMNLNGGSSGTPEISNWIQNGYDGVVSLTPHDCGIGSSNGDCEGNQGNHNGSVSSLESIRCAPSTPSASCFKFPVILDQGVSGHSHFDVNQRSFIFVILRGYNDACHGNGGCVFQLEFVDEQTTGVAGQNPGGGAATPVITSLCGIDHDTQVSRCSV